MSYQEKYLKYKNKYLNLITQFGGGLGNNVAAAAAAARPRVAGIGSYIKSTTSGLYWGQIVRRSGDSWVLQNERTARIDNENIRWEVFNLPPDVTILDTRVPGSIGVADPPQPPTTVGDYVIAKSNNTYLGRIREDPGAVDYWKISNILGGEARIGKSGEGIGWTALHLPKDVVIIDSRPMNTDFYPSRNTQGFSTALPGGGGGSERVQRQLTQALSDLTAMRLEVNTLTTQRDYMRDNMEHWRQQAHTANVMVAAGAGGSAGATAPIVLNPANDMAMPEKVEELDNNEEVKNFIGSVSCPICKVNIKKIIVCKNGHSLCETCADNRQSFGLIADPTCPVCRIPIDRNNFRKIKEKYLKY